MVVKNTSVAVRQSLRICPTTPRNHWRAVQAHRSREFEHDKTPLVGGGCNLYGLVFLSHRAFRLGRSVTNIVRTSNAFQNYLFVITIKTMNYEHDPAKLAANVRKHGVWFSAADDFEWETAQLEVDSRKRYGETRFIAAGLIGVRLFVLTFTLRGNAVRIISLRKANRREVQRYARQA